jgi:protein tyrosine phosphatase
MAPSSHTVESFWQMILENNVSLVIMLCPETENDKEMCIKYFEPKELGGGEATHQEFKFGDITLSIKSKKEKYAGLIVRKLFVSRNGSEPKIVTHI